MEIRAQSPDTKNHHGQFDFWASLINILLFPFWRWLFIISTPFDVDFIAAFNNSERNRFHIGAGLIVLTTLTIFFCLIFQLGKRFFPRFTEIIADILVLGSLLIAANYMRTSYIQILSFDQLMDWPALIKWGAIALGIVFLTASFYLVRKVAYAVIWILTPLVPVMIINLGYGIYTLAPDTSSFFSAPTLKPLSNSNPKTKTRVLLLLFDEMDQRIAFEKRPAKLALPTFDEIYKKAFVALEARPPHLSTWYSVPSTLVGDRVLGFSSNRRANKLAVRNPDGTKTPISETGTMFSDANSLDLNTAIISHKQFQFCDMFYHLSSRCWHRTGWATEKNDTVFARIPRIFDRIITHIPLFERIVFGAPRPGYDTKQIYIRNLKRLIEDLSTVAADPEYQFVFAHINVPHKPFIYDAESGSYTVSRHLKNGYFNNLRLADRIMMKIQTAMNKAELWDKTNVIITSDHGWRKNTFDGVDDSWHVPLIIKLEGQNQQVVLSDQIETVGLRKLVHSIFKGNIKTPKGIIQALTGVLDGT